MADDLRSSTDLPERLAAVERELHEVQEELRGLHELTAKAYEGTQQRAAEVLRARRASSYAAAYEPDPLVTVRIGTYRGGSLLIDRALRSVREQTHSNLEVIVVCDGPEEETAEQISALGDPRLRVIQRPRNGPYPAEQRARWEVAGTHPFNQAAAFARGAWIAPIDHDDEWSEDHLEVLLDVARNTGAEAVYGVGRTLLGDGTQTYFGSWPPALGDFGWQAAIYHAGFATLLYDINSHLLDEPADWNLARRMLEAGMCFEFVERIVVSYFVGEEEPAFGWWKARERERGAYVAGGTA